MRPLLCTPFLSGYVVGGGARIRQGDDCLVRERSPTRLAQVDEGVRPDASAMPYLLSSLRCVGTSQTRPWEYSSQVSATCCFVADLLGDGIVSTTELGSRMLSRPRKSIGSVQSGIPKVRRIAHK